VIAIDSVAKPCYRGRHEDFAETTFGTHQLRALVGAIDAKPQLAMSCGFAFFLKLSDRSSCVHLSMGTLEKQWIEMTLTTVISLAGICFFHEKPRFPGKRHKSNTRQIQIITRQTESPLSDSDSG